MEEQTKSRKVKLSVPVARSHPGPGTSKARLCLQWIAGTLGMEATMVIPTLGITLEWHSWENIQSYRRAYGQGEYFHLFLRLADTIPIAALDYPVFSALCWVKKGVLLLNTNTTSQPPRAHYWKRWQIKASLGHGVNPAPELSNIIPLSLWEGFSWYSQGHPLQSATVWLLLLLWRAAALPESFCFNALKFFTKHMTSCSSTPC